MKIFKEFPKKATYPICGGNMRGESVLVIIDGTEEEHIVEGQPVHVDCLELRMSTGQNGKKIIYQVVKDII